jgi:hypothetical protein
MGVYPSLFKWWSVRAMFLPSKSGKLLYISLPSKTGRTISHMSWPSRHSLETYLHPYDASPVPKMEHHQYMVFSVKRCCVNLYTFGKHVYLFWYLLLGTKESSVKRCCVNLYTSVSIYTCFDTSVWASKKVYWDGDVLCPLLSQMTYISLIYKKKQCNQKMCSFVCQNLQTQITCAVGKHIYLFWHLYLGIQKAIKKAMFLVAMFSASPLKNHIPLSVSNENRERGCVALFAKICKPK